MNSGMIYSLGTVILVILSATQWLDGWWRESVRSRIRLKMTLFFSLLFITQPLFVPLFSGVEVNVSCIIIPAPLFLYLLWRIPAGELWKTVAVIIYLAVFYAVSQQLFLLDPIMKIIPPLYFYPISFTLFTLVITEDLPRQWLMIGSGMIAGVLLHNSFIFEQAGAVTVGDAQFRDLFMLSLFSVAGCTLVGRYLIKIKQFVTQVAQARE